MAEKTHTGTMMSLLTQLKSGDSFHTSVKPNSVKAYAKLNKVNVTTAQCLLIESYTKEKPKAIKLTKVTIL